MRAGELDGKWYAKYWNPVMAPMPEHIKEAIGLGPQPPPLCLSPDDAATLSDTGYGEFENGYSLFSDGSAHIAVPQFGRAALRARSGTGLRDRPLVRPLRDDGGRPAGARPVPGRGHVHHGVSGARANHRRAGPAAGPHRSHGFGV